ncbi:MAG: 30S ribosomal protein S15 [Anaerolineae bacterium]|nr:30S ribosomal protein S15 [Anaerolineae bacterium]MDK1080766.1 30S ribosomal protein S15 [Anaerolineae bacterium]MDK1117932.1 30S ribosomal protein S15 [Anaerolineae bacterium]
MPLNKKIKTKAIKEFHRHDNDTGSPEVQIAILTRRISHLTEHLREHKHDESCRHGLLNMVGRRRRILTYLQNSNYPRYLSLTDELGLRRK